MTGGPPEPGRATRTLEEPPRKRLLVLGSLVQSFHCLRYLHTEVSGAEIVGFVPHQTQPHVRDDQNSTDYARQHGIPVLGTEDLADCSFDVGLSLMFDRPLPAAVVEKPPCGFVNIHLGPLPRLRGSNSVLHALRLAPVDHIWTFGITMHYMVEAVDQGPVIDVEQFPIFPDDTAAELHSRTLGAVFPLFKRNIQSIVDSPGRLAATPQTGPSRFFRKGEIDHLVDLSGPDEVILAQIRALAFPGKPHGYIMIGGTRIFLTLDETA